MNLGADELRTFAAVLLLGASTRLLAPPRASPAVQRAIAREAQLREARLQQRQVVIAQKADLRLVARDRDGVMHIVWGGLRAVAGREIRFGEGLAAAAIVDATPVRGGWIFRTVEGQLYASETFLGPLRVRTLPHGQCPRPWLQPSFGRAVVGSGTALYASDGGPFVRLDRALPLRAAAFGSDAWGVGLAHGGRLFETRDGGVSWARMTSLASVRAIALKGSAGGVHYLDGDWRSIGRAPPDPIGTLSYAAIEPVRSAFLERDDPATNRVVAAPPCSPSEPWEAPFLPFRRSVSTEVGGPTRARDFSTPEAVRVPSLGAGMEGRLVDDGHTVREESPLYDERQAPLDDGSVIGRGERMHVDPATGREPYYDRYDRDAASRRFGPRSLARQRYWRCAGARCDALDWATDKSNDGVIGFARHGDRWGVIAIERIFSDDGATQRTRFEASDGIEAVAQQLNLLVGGRWETSVRSPPCPDDRSPSEIHWVYGYERRDATFAGIRDTRVWHTVHEVRPEGVCLRRVEGDEYGVRSAALWLEARGGALVGAREDGSTITPLRERSSR